MARQNRLFSSAIWNVGGFFASTGLMLVVLPYVVSKLGMEDYGTFGLITALVAPMGLMAVGVSPGLVRSVAECHSRGKLNELADYLQSGTWISALIGLVGMGAIVIAGPLTFSILCPTAEVAPDVLWICFLFAGMQWAFGQLISAWSAVSAGLQEYHWTACGQALQNLLVTVFGVGALWMNTGLVGYVGANSLAKLVLMLFWLAVIGRRLGIAALRPTLHSAIARQFLHFGGWFSLAEVGKLCAAQGQQYLIGYFIGPAAVGVYNLASRVMSTIYGITGKFLEVLFPHFSGQLHRPMPERVRGLFLSLGACSVLCTALLGSLIPSSAAILTLWIGGEAADKGSSLLQLLCIGGIMTATAGPTYFFLLASGQSRQTAMATLLYGVIVVVVTGALLPVAGISAAGYATIVAGLVLWVCYAKILSKIVVESGQGRPGRTLLYALTPAVTAVPVLIAFSLLWRHVDYGWVSTILIYALCVACTAAVSLISLELYDSRYGSRIQLSKAFILNFKPLLDRLSK